MTAGLRDMQKPRLHRLAYTCLKHPLYFLTLCTHERKNILAHPMAHAAFQAFGESGAGHGAFVGRYVLMPDHLRLFVTFSPESAAVSIWVKTLKNTLSKTWRGMGITAPHWQKGFFDHVMRSAASYAEKWNYVAANSVRAGLAASPESWPFQGAICDLHF